MMSSYPQPAEPAEPPHHSIEAEQELLGAIFINNSALDAVSGLVEAKDFFEPVHREIFTQASRLRAAGKQVTPVTIYDTLPAGADVAGMSLRQYLARLTAEATTIINAPDFASIIRTTSTLRAIAAISDDVRYARRSGLSSESVLEDTWAEIDRIRLGTVANNDRTFSIAASAAVVVRHVSDIMSGAKNANGVPMGLVDLDRRMGGLMAGDLVLVAGRPGSGKSTLSTSIARQIACRPLRDGVRDAVGLFSLEMPELQTVSRILSDHLFDQRVTIPYQDILHGRIDMRTGGHLRDAQEELGGVPLIIDYSSRPSLAEIAAKIRGMKHTAKQMGARLRVAMIDYLKFVRPSDRYSGNRVAEFGEVSRGCKQIAKDEDICVVLLAQLNRQVESRDNKRPVLADLRDSGELEEDADVVMFCYREAYYLGRSPELGNNPALVERLVSIQNDMEVDVAKQRMGPTGMEHVWCGMATASIRNAARTEHSTVQAMRHEDMIDPEWERR